MSTDTPMNCPAHFAMHEVPCPYGCVTHCVRQAPALVNAELKSALSASRVGVPAEPTFAMVQAGAKLVKDNLPFHTGTKAIYEAMLAAAPQPAQPAGEPALGDRDYTPEELVIVAEHTRIPVDFKKKMALFEMLDAFKNPDDSAALPSQSPPGIGIIPTPNIDKPSSGYEEFVTGDGPATTGLIASPYAHQSPAGHCRKFKECARTARDDQINFMVDRFLGWQLPENFSPDAGISFKPDYNEHTACPMKHKPIGTNLFDATQAEAMVRYLVDGMPKDSGI